MFTFTVLKQRGQDKADTLQYPATGVVKAKRGTKLRGGNQDADRI